MFNMRRSRYADKYVERNSVIPSEYVPEKLNQQRFNKKQERANEAEKPTTIQQKDIKRGRGRGSPIAFETNHHNYQNFHTNPKALDNDDSVENYYLKEKTKDYMKKLEYRKALDQQIMEQKMKKRQEKDMYEIENKQEDTISSYARLKTKISHDIHNTGEKPISEKVAFVPIYLNGELLQKQVEHEKYENFTTIPRKLSDARRVITPMERQGTGDSKYRSRSTMRASMYLTFK